MVEFFRYLKYHSTCWFGSQNPTEVPQVIIQDTCRTVDFIAAAPHTHWVFTLDQDLQPDYKRPCSFELLPYFWQQKTDCDNSQSVLITFQAKDSEHCSTLTV